MPDVHPINNIFRPAFAECRPEKRAEQSGFPWFFVSFVSRQKKEQRQSHRRSDRG